jgi:hypothetical protein
MKYRIILLTVLCFLSIAAFSQPDFRPGYIVNSDGDTIKGLIDYRGEQLMGKICRFKPGENERVIIFSPDQLVEYKFDDGKYCVSKEVDGKKTFLQFLVKGKINLYSLRDAIGDHFFIEKPGLGLTELQYKEEIIYKENVPYKYESTAHIGLLFNYMQDATDFQPQIIKMHSPKERLLVQLVEDYHNNVCKDQACIVYKKKIPFIKVAVELSIGQNNFLARAEDNFLYYGQGSQKRIQGGVLANIGFPTFSEKLYLRTGVIFTSYEIDGQIKKYRKIPFQIEYIYTRGFINPKLAYGINFYKPFNESTSLMPGINFKLSNTISLELNYNLDFVSSRILLPEKLFSTDITSGLYINF